MIHYITRPDDFMTMRAAVLTAETVALDLETTGLDPRSDRIRLVSLFVQGSEQVFVLDLFALGVGAELRSFFTELLGSQAITKIGHNFAFDLAFLQYRFQIPVIRQVYCTLLGSQILEALYLHEGFVRHGLADVARRFAGADLSKDQQKSDWSAEVLSEAQIRYAAHDTLLLPLIREKQLAEISSNDLLRVAALEMRALPVVVGMKLRGVRLDTAAWRKLLEEKIVRRNALEAEVKEMLQAGVDWTVKNKKGSRPGRPKILKRDERERPAWVREQQAAYQAKLSAWEAIPAEITPEILLTSPLQVLKSLKNLGVPLKDSTLERYLLPFQDKFPVIKKLLEFREVDKLATAFGQTILDMVSSDGRIHADIRQIGAVSGRFAIANPNLYQMPRDKAHRKCFIPADGYNFVIADYSAEELMLLAEISGDPLMCQLIRDGVDLHIRTASQLLDKPESQVTKDERQASKMLNYAAAYQVGAGKVSDLFGVSYDEGQAVLDSWRKMYAKAQEWIESAAFHMRKHGMIRCMNGRLIGATINPYDKGSIAAAGRLGSNAPIQGTGSSILKLAMIGVTDRVQAGGYDAGIVLAPHDELVVEVRSDQAETVAVIVKEEMEKAIRKFVTRVPTAVETAIGASWADK